jgi:hypothetical protein
MAPECLKVENLESFPPNLIGFSFIIRALSDNTSALIIRLP